MASARRREKPSASSVGWSARLMKSSVVRLVACAIEASYAAEKARKP